MSTGHDGAGEEKTATQARQGIALGIVRWVLLISLVLVILAFVVSFFIA